MRGWLLPSTPEGLQDSLTKFDPGLKAPDVADVYGIWLIPDDHKQTVSLKLLRGAGEYNRPEVSLIALLRVQDG